jgi:hypothetical protein
VAEAIGLPHVPHPESKGQVSTNNFGSAPTIASQPNINIGTIPPTTRTPTNPPGTIPSDTTVQVPERKSSKLPIVIGIGVVAVAGVLVLALRKPGTTPVPPPKTETTTQPRIAEPTYVRIRVESTPVGARIVRASDGVVLGTTPQTLELRQAPEPLGIRLEKEGFLPLSRDLSLGTNSTLAAVMEAAPTQTNTNSTTATATDKNVGGKKPGHGGKTPTGGGHTSKPDDEPAKL